jgi:hypothetical protein
VLDRATAMALFNDPNCIDATGRYIWAPAEGALTLI